MATVLVGAYGADPSTIWPEKYSSCFWNFTTGWTCQTVETQAAPSPTPTQPLGNTPDPNANPVMLPVAGSVTGGNAGGCCGKCGGSPMSSSTSVVPVLSGEVTATGKQCGGDCKCGYTNREALLAVAVAFLFFILVRK